MRINKWSATMAAVAVLLASSVSAEPGKAKADRSDAESTAREAVKDHRHDMHEMESAAATGERVTAREEHSKGTETASEMQERREQRKEIQEEYREGREAGGTAKAQKKPWWKFWGSDDS